MQNNPDMIRNTVLKYLNDAPTYVGFRKVNGDRRAIRGTLNKEVLEQTLGQFDETYDEAKQRYRSNEVVAFYDLDANWWKSAKVENIDMLLLTGLNEMGDGRAVYFNRNDDTVIVKPVMGNAIHSVVEAYLKQEE